MEVDLDEAAADCLEELLKKFGAPGGVIVVVTAEGEVLARPVFKTPEHKDLALPLIKARCEALNSLIEDGFVEKEDGSFRVDLEAGSVQGEKQ